jgi:hypothetical protein
MDDWTVLEDAQFQFVPYRYPDEESTENELPNIDVYKILRERLWAKAGGALHIGAPPINDPAPGFHTMTADALDTFHMYRGVTSTTSTLDTSGSKPTQLSSKCCNFIDQNDIEYVLWDRRAYTRDWMIPVSKRTQTSLVMNAQVVMSAYTDVRSSLFPTSALITICAADHRRAHVASTVSLQAMSAGPFDDPRQVRKTKKQFG